MYDETWGSDHHPFLITVNVEKAYYHKKSVKIYSVRTNWSNVALDLDSVFPDLFLSNEYDKLSPSQKYDYFFDVISRTIKANTPTKKNCKPRNS